MKLSPKHKFILAKLIEVQDEIAKEYQSYNLNPDSVVWSLTEAGVSWHDVKDLVYAGIVQKVGRKNYRLKSLKEAKKLLENDDNEVEDTIPDDLFNMIEGYDDIKRVIMMSLKADKPIHILLVGPPGTAKTLFLLELQRLKGAYFVTAGSSTKVGLRDVLFYELPRYLIIDELEKIENVNDLSVLLTWMESGRVIVATHNMYDERSGKGWVFAACNSDYKLPPELKDRFEIFTLKPYDEETYRRVVVSYLTTREKKDKELAEYIADKLSRNTNSVREAVRIARLSKTKEDVDFLLSVIDKYSR